jgi:hypothetical protein
MCNKIKPFTVRVIYVVPLDAEPWEEAKRRATEWLEDIQWFFADEMERYGYGRKTFEIARNECDELVFNQISSSLTKQEFGKNRWRNCIRAAEAKGLQSTNDAVVYFYETYDGEASNQGSKGGKNKGGAFLGSLYLKRAKREWIASNNKYDGEVSEWKGKKLGDLSGRAFGIMTHELSHAFGLSDDEDDNKNRKMNLMGSGCRRMRGYFLHDPTHGLCEISEENAAFLDKSRFFAVRELNPRSISFSPETAK